MSYRFVRKIKPVLKLKLENRHPSNDIFYLNNPLRVSSSLSYGASFNQIDMLGGVGLIMKWYLGSDINIVVFDAGFTGVESLPIFDNLKVIKL